jgi:hypothetical protein
MPIHKDLHVQAQCRVANGSNAVKSANRQRESRQISKNVKRVRRRKYAGIAQTHT